MKTFITSESVTEGHPDKLCDYISDSILDAYLNFDNTSRVACETLVSKNEVYITGEITSNADIDIEQVVRNAIKEIGYDSKTKGLDYKSCSIKINISKQSPDIAQGVIRNGAGDQGIMYGYACNETKEFMPLSITLAHKLAKELTRLRKDKILNYLYPDGKTQVTIEYDKNKPVRIEAVVISAHHNDKVELENLRKDIKIHLINKIIPADLLDDNTKIFINPTGRFVIGGPMADSGLTGRKIMVDTYGTIAHHGGGAFSGKDATKVDRSAAYMARFLAKNIVANGYATKCEISLSYAIGVIKPLALNIETFNTHTISVEKIIEKINESFDLTSEGIIKFLDLKNPIYKNTTNYGHFGKSEMTWEKIIKF